MKLKFRNHAHDLIYSLISTSNDLETLYDWKQCSEHVKNADLFYWIDKNSLRITSVILVFKYSWKKYENCLETEFNIFKLIQKPNCSMIMRASFTWHFHSLQEISFNRTFHWTMRLLFMYICANKCIFSEFLSKTILQGETE